MDFLNGIENNILNPENDMLTTYLLISIFLIGIYAITRYFYKEQKSFDTYLNEENDKRHQLASTFSVGQTVILNETLGGRVNDLYLPKGEIGIVHGITRHGAVAVRFDRFYASLDPRYLDKQIKEEHQGAD